MHIPTYLPAKHTPQWLANRPLLPTAQGGAVAVDARLLDIWRYAQGRTLPEVVEHFGYLPYEGVRAALACLAEGDVLTRGQREPLQRASVPVENTEGARVSVVLVSFNSRSWLETCLSSLKMQTWQPLEIIVVDNGSQDDTISWLREHHPDVRLLPMSEPGTLASALNAGMAQAAGEYFLLLNPDVRLAPDAVAHMMRVACSAADVAAVAPKLRFLYAPAFLNGLGNRVGMFGFGVDNALGHLDLGQFDTWHELPSACFAAVLIPRRAWEAIGPLDDAYPLYYEDSDWSYRARLMGWRVLAAPQAVIYHAYGAHIAPQGQSDGLSPLKLGYVTMGRYRFAFKIPAAYRRFLLTYALEDVARSILALLKRDWARLRVYVHSWRTIWRRRDALWKARKSVQSQRTVSDDALFSLQRQMPMPHIWRGLPELTWDLVLHEYLPLMKSSLTYPVPEFSQQPVRLLIISHDIVDEKMAGPGMRYLEMARALQCDALQVTLAVPRHTSLQADNISLQTYRDGNALRTLAASHDVVLFSAYLLDQYPFLAKVSARRVVDLYDPLALENLHYHLDKPLNVQQALHQQVVAQMNRLVQVGDFFLCGNERQRDFWLGVLAANGRVNPYTYAQDKTLKKLLDVVGIGFPTRPPQRKAPFLLGVHPAIPEDARIVLWGGGIWNWLDPLTLVRAWPKVVAQHPKARLVFLGTRHPNPLVPVHEMAHKTEALVEELGEKDRSIIFLEWVSYTEREALLVEADVGVTLHPVHVETRYSARTRVLDYLWARLPVLITEGDVTSEWVQTYGIGRVVSAGDVDGVTAALIDLLAYPKGAFAAAFEPLLNRFSWPQVVQPLQQYCLYGALAPDRQHINNNSLSIIPIHRLSQIARVWRMQGGRALLRKLWRYLQWRFQS